MVFPFVFQPYFVLHFKYWTDNYRKSSDNVMVSNGPTETTLR